MPIAFIAVFSHARSLSHYTTTETAAQHVTATCLRLRRRSNPRVCDHFSKMQISRLTMWVVLFLLVGFAASPSHASPTLLDCWCGGQVWRNHPLFIDHECPCPPQFGRKIQLKTEITRRVEERRPSDRALMIWKPHSPWVNHEWILCKMYGITKENCPSGYMPRGCYGDLVQKKQSLSLKEKLQVMIYRLVMPNLPIWTVTFTQRTLWANGFEADNAGRYNCPRIEERLLPDHYSEPPPAEEVFGSHV